jgi:adenosylcobinamide-GDP ribazoletransferase
MSLLPSLRLALSFLTILPVRPPREVSPAALAKSGLFFPAVGWLLGGLAADGAWLAARLHLSPLPAAVLLVALLAWLTRGLHLDGLADLLDGLGGGATPEKRLAIMKDSSIGVFGAAGLVLLLLAKASGLAVLLQKAPAGPSPALFLLAAPPIAARWGILLLAWRSPYPRPAGTGHPFVGRISTGLLAAAFLWLLPLFLFGTPALLVVLASLLPAFWLRLKARRALGGITGDVLGAACELGEAAGWLAAAFLL